MPPVVYTVSKNEPTLASCSFVKHGLILIIFGKQHRYTFRNYAHILLSLSFHVYLLYLLFSRTLLRYVRLMTWAARLSSVCLSSVTLLHRLELFGNIFAPPNSSGTQTVCVKILGKNAKGFYGIVKVKYNGVWKIDVFRPTCRFISKMVRDVAIVITGDE